MVRLRPLHERGLRARAEALRPRFLVVRIRAKGIHLRWAIPAWAVEEVLRFALRIAPLLPLWRGSRRLARPRDGTLLQTLDGFFGERKLLTLPPGEPYVSIETSDALIEIRPYSLGVRS